jgi:hypothetical protein
LANAINHLPFTAWIALWLALMAPAMCQRHGLLYFHAAAPESSPAWADDFMCGAPSAPSEQSADAQHHTTRVLQSSVLLVFMMPELMLAVETAHSSCYPSPLRMNKIASFASEPLSPPPRHLSAA